MNEVIGNGYAEEVHNEGREGEKWYIPHHSKKPGKLCVISDCSAKYKGTSLNNHLLSGPDLTYNLIGVVI